MQVQSIDQVKYNASVEIDEDAIIAKAMDILDSRIKNGRTKIDGPASVRSYLRLKHGQRHQEVFGVIFLDTALNIIACEDMFYGTINSCSVHPREILKSAIKHDANSIILYHNHPTGSSTPSNADIVLTKNIVELMKMVNIQTVDHFIITVGEVSSLAEAGYI